jgi:hypothetical protein
MLPGKQINLIKIDVEGAELQVINGMKKTLSQSRPVITLSLYHNPQDIWTLPELLFNLCDNYSFFIRQHYFNSFDSVFYAVPN